MRWSDPVGFSMFGDEWYREGLADLHTPAFASALGKTGAEKSKERMFNLFGRDLL